MEFGPIWRAGLRSKTGPVLMALQIALTLAVIVNAVFIIEQRIENIARPTGMDIENIVTVQSFGIGEDFDLKESVPEDLRALEQIPGVIAVTSSQHVPLSGSGWGTEFSGSVDEDAPRANAAQYFVNSDALNALGVRLESGRGFSPDDIEYPENYGIPYSRAIVTRAYLDALFPDGGATAGTTIYDNLGNPVEVVGVLERMHGAWVGWDQLENVVLVPRVMPTDSTYYIVRTEPGERDRVMPQVEQTLLSTNDRRIVKSLRTHSEIKDNSYMGDRGMAIVLSVVVGLMILVTGVGIVGLASFSVRQRIKQIGTRRAIGARRRDIVRYFVLENLMITTVGVALGAVLTLAVNYLLVVNFELERLDPVYVPAGILALWLLGLLAVAGPARKASSISPAIATRTI
ncbi:MAG: FtsX-like permease family protein [Gammaproteobacteria bacterium]